MNEQTQNAPPAPPSRAVAIAEGLKGFKSQLAARVPEIASALPAHIPPERFERVVMTAVQNNLDLLTADRQSVFNSCMRAAADGLLPDGRDGAIVVYNTKAKGGEAYKKLAQWMPMVQGIQKKARNSGELSGINAHVVYRDDEFDYWVDENGAHLLYRPADAPNMSRENVRLVFAWARTKDGELFVEKMSVAEVEKVRAVSRAKDGGPWSQWWDQMACKTVIRRLSKRLPMSSDLDDLIRRDDTMYDLDATPQERKPGVLDMSAKPAQIVDRADTSQPAHEGGGEAQVADTVEHTGGNDDAPPPSPFAAGSVTVTLAVSDGDKLLGEIANVLLDCKTHPDCDGVYKLFQKEISEADARTQAKATILIEDAKAAISKANDESFPGGR